MGRVQPVIWLVSSLPTIHRFKVRVWLQAAGIDTSLLFRRISSSGSVGDAALSDKTVVRLIKRTGRAAGLNEKRYSGHSLRRGFLTSAATNRVDVLKMVAQSRHANINTILAYVDNQQLFDNHAGERLLQPTVASEEDSTLEPEDCERSMRPTTS